MNVLWLISGEGEKISDPSKLPARPVTVEPSMVQKLTDAVEQITKVASKSVGNQRQTFEPPPPPTIKYLPLRASAGGGSAVLYESQGVDLDMDQLAAELLGVRRKYIRLLRIKGDSMLPTLVNGDIVVVDRSRPKVGDDPDEDKIYVVSINGEMFAKRARWTDDGSLLWCSDNDLPEYAPIKVCGVDFNAEKVIGEVVWVWRPL